MPFNYYSNGSSENYPNPRVSPQRRPLTPYSEDEYGDDGYDELYERPFEQPFERPFGEESAGDYTEDYAEPL